MLSHDQNIVCVPISAETVADVIGFVHERSGTIGLGEFVQLSVDYLMDNIASKPEDLLRLLEPKGLGYMWKSVFLPDGTQVRMKYKGDWHYAAVDGDELMADDEVVSPSQFANAVAGTSRNAWRDLYIKRPADRTWILADTVRRQS